MKRIGLAVALVAVLVLAVVATGGPPPPAANPAGTFSFAVLGDAPYYAWEEWQFRIVLDDLDAHELSSVVHVGDAFWKPCTDAMYRKAFRRLDRLRHPVIYTPGDNEWADCWMPAGGSFAPLERLRSLRRVFFANPGLSLGRRPIGLASQEEIRENARWSHRGVVFATVHVVGSGNATEPFPRRTREDDDAAAQRTAAAAAWVRATFAEAAAQDASAVVLAFHAVLPFGEPAHDPERRMFEPLLGVLEDEVARFGKPVLAAHGDGHEFTVDHPLRRLDRFTRLEVPGSPQVGWVRVAVTPGAPAPFRFEARVVPRWKYW